MHPLITHMMKHLSKLFLLFLGLNSTTGLFAQKDTLRVVYYNLLKFPGSTADRADSFKVIFDYLKPDILCVTELLNESGADLILNTSLGTNYARTPYIDGFDTETQVYYNTNKLGMVRYDSISTAGSTSVGASRYIGYTRLYCKEPSLGNHRDTQYVDVIGMHLTASNSSSDSISRYVQTKMLKNWMSARPHIKFVLVGGDLNVYTDQEVGYQTLLDSGSTKLKDPINRPGRWNNNAAFADVHTQSTRVRAFNGGATGGMDDRFDFILTSDSILQGSRLKYIPNTYKAVANNGQLFNDSLTHPPLTTLVPWPILSALYNAADHLPVYMEMEFTYKQVISLTDADAEAFHLTVSPNPTQGLLQVVDHRATSQPLQYKLTDLAGKELLKGNLQGNTTLDLTHLPSGLYLLYALQDEAQTCQRILLQH